LIRGSEDRPFKVEVRVRYWPRVSVLVTASTFPDSPESPVSSPGCRPRARADYRRFLRRSIDEYQAALRSWEAATAGRERPKALAYWRERLDAARVALRSA
jgi:hypothetical protein